MKKAEPRYIVDTEPRLVATGLPDLKPMVRAEGAHVSSVIRKLCIGLGHFEDDAEGEGPDQTRLELGSAFEDALIHRYNEAFPGRYVRLPELSYDGMFGNADLFDIDDWCIVEIKCTWMSANHHPSSKKFWKYWVQGKAYAKMAASIGCETTKVRVVVGHLNGTYNRFKSGDPIVNHWQHNFSQSEIDSNWSMIRSASTGRGE